MNRPERIAIEALDSAGCGLRAVFTRRGDLFEHAIVAVQAGAETPLFDCDQLPLQEVVQHGDSPDRRALLATGAGDGRYWSLSITPTADLRLALLEFDVACRDLPQWPPPAVTYRLARDVSLQGDVLALADGRRFKIGCGSLPTSIAAELAPTCALESSPREVVVRSLRAQQVSTAKMTRWRYQFSFVRPA